MVQVTAVTWVWSLVQELPHATGADKKRRKKNHLDGCQGLLWSFWFSRSGAGGLKFYLFISLSIDLYVYVFKIFGYIHSMRKFPGHGLNPHRHSDNASSLTTRPPWDSMDLKTYTSHKFPGATDATGREAYVLRTSDVANCHQGWRSGQETGKRYLGYKGRLYALYWSQVTIQWKALAHFGLMFSCSGLIWVCYYLNILRLCPYLWI